MLYIFCCYFNFLEKYVKNKFIQSHPKTDGSLKGMIMRLEAKPNGSRRETPELSVVRWLAPSGQCPGQMAGPQVTSALTSAGKAKGYLGLLQMEGLRSSQVWEMLVPGVGAGASD